MTPPKKGVFTNIGKHFAETLQLQDLAVNNFFLFYYLHIFVKKVLNLYKMHFLQTKKFLVCLKGHSNTLWLSSAIKKKKSTLKKCIWYQLHIFSQNMHVIKKRNFWLQGLQITAFQQSFSKCWWSCYILEG